FFQAPTPGVLQWLDIPSYLQGGVLAVLVIANIIVISLHARTWADVQKRAGCLAVTHLVPLCSGFSFSLPAHVYYVGRDTFYWAHRWLGRICVLHCLLHGSVLGANARNTSHGARLVIPLLAGCSLVSILPWTLAAILRRWPQLGLKVHYMLASIATGALFYHLIDRCRDMSAYYVVPRRITSRRALARPFNQLLWLDIAVPMEWEAQPGQYVQLWMPRLGWPDPDRAWLEGSHKLRIMRRIRRFIFRSACSVRMGNHLTLASTGPSSLYLKTLDSSARCRSYDISFKKAEAGETLREG
ncbi:hypothetical protein PENNAL_c0396G00313, partial [Penicillium nalgiovense]